MKGLKVVPREPTKAMFDAARQAFFGEVGTDAQIQRIWDFMLEAFVGRLEDVERNSLMSARNGLIKENAKLQDALISVSCAIDRIHDCLKNNAGESNEEIATIINNAQDKAKAALTDLC